MSPQINRKSLPNTSIILVFVGVILTCFLTFASLNPFDSRMFDFHDETQAGRVTSFVQNLREYKIPPRLAPEYSFNLGFPVFNFYGPFAYWVTSIMALLDLPSYMAVKASFLFAIIVSFISMFYLLTRYFDELSSFLGASVYVTSTYFATQIVIRGNLAESWFLALFPLAYGLVLQQSRKGGSRILFVVTSIILSFLFTVHNIMSLLSLLIIFCTVMILPRKRVNFLSFCIAIVLGGYFLIPALLEMNFVQAASNAKQFLYTDHFLCPWQLWSANGWQFGGSLKGCDADLMSFKLGKIQMVLGLAGLIMLLKNLYSKRKLNNASKIYIFIGFFTCVSLFLTVEYSQSIWSLLSPVMSLFQFPWRLLVFGMFGLGFFAAYFHHSLNKVVRVVFIVILVPLLFISGRKYFIKPLHEGEVYTQRYNSQTYRQSILAYNMREYLAAGVDYEYWHSLNPLEVNSNQLDFDYELPVQTDASYTIVKNDLFAKEVSMHEPGELYLNVHYFPFWHITINGKTHIPDQFDNLKRPILQLRSNDVVAVQYKQTKVEMLGNAITLLGVFVLLMYSPYRRASQIRD